MIRRFRPFALALLCVAASSAGWAARDLFRGETAAADTRVPARLGAPELDTGFFRVNTPGQSHAVGWVWARTENDVLKETWLLFRPETSEGWPFPGANHTNVTFTFVRQTACQATTVAEFEDWAEGQYPGEMSVDADEDFLVHAHTISVL